MTESGPDEFTTAPEWGGRPLALSVAEASPRQRLVSMGIVQKTDTAYLAGAVSYLCIVDDGTDEIDLLFVGRKVVAGLTEGTFCQFEGTVLVDNGRLTIWNPLYRIVNR